MSTFWNKFNQEIADLREREYSLSPGVENFQRKFKEKAEAAERLFREKERVEEELRKAGKSSNR